MTIARHNSVVWVLEKEAFPESHAEFRHAAESQGLTVQLWNDEWIGTQRWPLFEDRAVVFHGSLGNADTIARRVPWRPGSYCNTAAFFCSAWYPQAQSWLLHQRCEFATAESFVANPASVLSALGMPEKVFVRPDSPLKPFSGRVVSADRISLKALDHGYYYDDATIPIVVAPVRSVSSEWRYVIVDKVPVAGSGYSDSRQSTAADAPGSMTWEFAAKVAQLLDAPDDVYVMDLCEADGRLWLLELNPFSGADLYACPSDAVITAVTAAAQRLSYHG